MSGHQDGVKFRALYRFKHLLLPAIVLRLREWNTRPRNLRTCCRDHKDLHLLGDRAEISLICAARVPAPAAVNRSAANVTTPRFSSFKADTVSMTTTGWADIGAAYHVVSMTPGLSRPRAGGLAIRSCLTGVYTSKSAPGAVQSCENRVGERQRCVSLVRAPRDQAIVNAW